MKAKSSHCTEQECSIPPFCHANLCRMFLFFLACKILLVNCIITLIIALSSWNQWFRDLIWLCQRSIQAEYVSLLSRNRITLLKDADTCKVNYSSGRSFFYGDSMIHISHVASETILVIPWNRAPAAFNGPA